MRLDVYDRQRNHHEHNIGDEIGGRHSSGRGHVVWDSGFEGGPDCLKADVDAFAADPGLEGVWFVSFVSNSLVLTYTRL